MKVIDIIKDAAQRATQDLNLTLTGQETAKIHYLRAFNLIYGYFNNRYPWPWRDKTISIQTIPNYVDGTVAVTPGSRTVTGFGTLFTSAMEGRFFKLTTDTELYQIKKVNSSTQLILADPYITGNGGGSYLIWAKFYDLPPDVPQAKGVYLWQWPHKSAPIPFDLIADQYSQAYLYGFPEGWSWYGVNRSTTTYSTGTVILTKDSKTLTGVGTSFIGNVFEGSRITVSSNVYNIETIDSDTQITMAQNSLLTSPTNGDTYKIETFNRNRITLSSVPNPALNLYLTYPKRVYNLVNDNDEPAIWDGYEVVLANILYAYILEKLSSNRSFSWMQITESQIKEVIKDVLDGNPVQQALMPQTVGISGYRRSLYNG